jgi:hypothetical protein
MQAGSRVTRKHSYTDQPETQNPARGREISDTRQALYHYKKKPRRTKRDLGC